MSKHPLNLALRFILEVAAIITFGLYGYSIAEGAYRILLAILFPLIFATFWGVFAVKNDPSRSGKTVVQTPGILRLLLEFLLFGLAAWLLRRMGNIYLAGIFAMAFLLHYLFSLDRIAWLLRQK